MNNYVASVSSNNSNTIVAQPVVQKPVETAKEKVDNGGGLFSKIFGSSFSRTSANLMTGKPKTNDADISPNPFSLNQNIVVGLGPPAASSTGKDKLQNVVFQTFDNITTTKNRPISNTNYLQSPPLFAQLKLEGAPIKNGGAPLSSSSKGGVL
jgi:hypothetical protein